MIEGLNRVLIVGGGIGGMASAIALRKQGVDVEIVERDPEWKVYGAGITITGPTLRAFRDLGLLEAIRHAGYFSSSQRIYLFDGAPMGEQDVPQLEPGLPASGAIMRPKLHQIMSEEVLRLGVAVRLGVTVTQFEQVGGQVEVTFSDGATGSFSLMIGADGIYSQTRATLFPGAEQPTYTGQMSWRVVAPHPPGLDRTEFFFGHSNIGGINPCSQDEVYAFILNPAPQADRIPDVDQPEYLKNLIKDFGGSMAAIRDGIGPHSSIVQRPFEYCLQPAPWHVGRIILIGDAAHATTPHLASGAGIAVEDGLVLAEELNRCSGDIDAGLRAFTQRRFERCRYVVETSVAIGKRQLEDAPAPEIAERMGKAMHYLAGPI
jgi:2-polyprenyl-6-methoxyphenol hydroxylase-like FAD-dependent oxidoreductase